MTEEHTADTDLEEQVTPFAVFLQDYGQGRLHARLTDGLNELVAAVRDTGSKGSLTLKIDVKPIDGARTQVAVVAEVVPKVPRSRVAPATYFIDAAANLRLDDPNQLTLPLREVPRPEIREGIAR